MNRDKFYEWMKATGYIPHNDWQYQKIGSATYYFIINPNTDRFALIEQAKSEYNVLLSGWEDFNGWAEQFHKETNYFWKKTK